MKAAGAAALKFARKPQPNIWAALVFGDDDGVVGDVTRLLLKAWTPKGAGVEIISLDEDAIKREPAILFDALEAQSLLGDTRLLRLSVSGEKLSPLILEAFALGEKEAGRFAAKWVIQAGSLKAKSKLRATAETAASVMALQTFPDEVGDLSALTLEELKRHRAEIDPDALAAFTASLPGHRALAHAEIEKLCLYSRGLGRPLSLADIRSLSATDVDHAVDDLIIAALSGDMSRAVVELDKLLITGTSAITVYRGVQREVSRMLAAHSAMASGGGYVGMQLRPPVWKTDWPAFHGRLSKWPPQRLTRTLEKVYDAECLAKLAGRSAEPAMRILILEITRVAARHVSA